MKHGISCAVLLLLPAFLAGCAGLPAGSAAETDTASPGSDDMLARRVAGAGQATLLYARSVHVDPVLRPVSHVATGSSLLIKSAAGTLRRLALHSLQMPALDDDIPPLSGAAAMDLEAFERELDRITGTRSSRGTIEFLVDGDAYFTRLESAIDGARKSIDIRTYIFDNDDYAVAVAERLKRSAAEGVHVRVMFDTLGNMQAMQVDPDSLPDSHRAPLSMTNFLERDSDVRVRSIANPWLAGDHTKTTIIDREIAFVGGMNIGREYRYDWHDLMMEVRGPVVDELKFESDKAWARAGPFGDLANLAIHLRGKRPTAPDVGYPVRVLRTRNFDSDIYKAQIAAIRSARRYIVIENPYFSDDRTLYELARARRRGVDVRLIIPADGNHGAMNASNRVAINAMLEHGIRVYHYPGMTHVKAAVFDGWACIGSANFDKLSLDVNKELNLATSEPAVIAALFAEVLGPDLRASEEIEGPLDVSVAARLAEILVDEML